MNTLVKENDSALLFYIFECTQNKDDNKSVTVIFVKETKQAFIIEYGNKDHGEYEEGRRTTTYERIHYISPKSTSCTWVIGGNTEAKTGSYAGNIFYSTLYFHLLDLNSSFIFDLNSLIDNPRVNWKEEEIFSENELEEIQQFFTEFGTQGNIEKEKSKELTLPIPLSDFMTKSIA